MVKQIKKTVTVFVANDGTEFTSYNAAEEHEGQLAKADEAHKEKRDRWYKSRDGIQTLRKHAYNERGVWQILGEDPNCDFGGYHHMPFLGVVSGTLDEAIDWAVDHPEFFQWGAGGSIMKIEVIAL